MTDLELLRKFEPVVCYTHGEMFFPASVESYVPRCSLWERAPNGDVRRLVEEGALDIATLAEYRDVAPGHTLYLRLVAEPMPLVEYQRWRSRPDRPAFTAPGRLARVGLLSRIVDAGFDATLFVRGKVPGGTTAVAERKYQDALKTDKRRVYYGRVVRSGGYIVLQYFFFFFMNDYRSSFFGVNDHESDWEQIMVYVTEERDGDSVTHTPRWVAYASHDFSGDDLRRRWDDAELHKHGDSHPIVYAGAGSHASYFLPGEYIMAVEPGFVSRSKVLRDRLVKFWSQTLGQGLQLAQEGEAGIPVLSVPFVDYARGDGNRIGPEQSENWDPIVLTDDDPWAAHYRGLWGLETHDFFGGERAPSGPKFNRDGTVRMSWYNPVGWAGLDKVLPPAELVAGLERKLEGLHTEREQVASSIDTKRAELRNLELEIAALQKSEYGTHIEKSREDTLEEQQAALQALFKRRNEIDETVTATANYLRDVRKGDFGNPQAHLKHIARPAPPVGRISRVAEVWSAISGAIFLLTLVVVLLYPSSGGLLLAILTGFVFFGIDAAVRSRLVRYLLNVTVLLALVAGVILVINFWRILLTVGFIALVLLLLRDNLRELSFLQPRGQPPATPSEPAKK